MGNKLGQLSFEFRPQRQVYIGSNKVLLPTSLQAFYTRLHCSLGKGPATSQNCIDKLNGFTSGIAFLLSLTTGARSYQSLSVPLTLIDIKDGLISINDKKQGDLHIRQLPLGQFMREQLGLYINILRMLASKIGIVYPHLADNLHKILDAELGLLQYFNRKGECYAETGKMITKALSAQFNHFLKFNRHFLWNSPCLREAPPEIASSFMGNESRKEHSNHLYSTRSSSEMRRIADKIDTYLVEELGFQHLPNPFKSWI